MTFMTTVKVSSTTRDELKTLAEREEITLDAALQKLLKAERQRHIGRDLADRPITPEDREWITASTSAMSRAIG